MKLGEVKEKLDAQVLCGEDKLDIDISSAFGCDLMSDVLAYVLDQDLLLTGLSNMQAIRTADMMDIKCLVFVRGKIPDSNMVGMANDVGIVVMTTKLNMFNACGILFTEGLR